MNGVKPIIEAGWPHDGFRKGLSHPASWAEEPEDKMFEKDEVLKELHARLVAAGINPLDPKVQAISEVVNAFYAEKTREVLVQMQAVLSKIET